MTGATGYIDVAGLRTWHEVSGDGDPLVLLHGAFVGVAALPEARLAVLPGSHTLPLERPELVNPLIASFLRDTDTTPDWDSLTG